MFESQKMKTVSVQNNGRMRAFVTAMRRPKAIVLALLTLTMVSSVYAVSYMRHQLAVPEAVLPTLNGMDKGVAFYDRANHYICTVHSDRDREIVPLARISANMRNAVIAAEDRRFYNHFGLDLWGIARAVWANHKKGHVVEGASTITQQLVRNLYLDKNDRSMSRKLKEAFLAIDVERGYSKPKILETYLNETYFGGGVFGVERAAQHYFNKHASALTVPESAFLAALVKSPSTLGDPAHRASAIKPQHLVLDKMVECNMLTENEAQQAKSVHLAFKSGPSKLRYPAYIGYALQVLQKEVGDELWKNKWKAYTNLDVKAQQAAEHTLEQGIAHAPAGVNQGALVTLSVKDGAMLAMVGGVDKDNEWNRALFPHTAGSAFKPFVYLTGISQGVIWPDTLIDDSAITIENPGSEPYSPKNFDGKFVGWLPASQALAQSRNVCSVRVAEQVGINRVIETAQAAGIKSQLDPYPALALGCCAVTPLEMATAYSTLARKGAYMAPQVLRKIQTVDGHHVKDFQAPTSVNLDQEAVAELVEAMQDVVRCGTGTLARLPGMPVAGKTGTADKSKDLWFIGFTPDTVTAVWGGNDQNHEVRGGHSVTGGAVMARIWHDYMTQFYRINPPTTRLAFDPPSYKLVPSNPRYDDAQLVANRDPYANKIGDNSIRATIGPDAVIDPEKIKKVGMVRAFDVQRSAVMQRLSRLAVQPQSTESECETTEEPAAPTPQAVGSSLAASPQPSTQEQLAPDNAPAPQPAPDRLAQPPQSPEVSM